MSAGEGQLDYRMLSNNIISLGVGIMLVGLFYVLINSFPPDEPVIEPPKDKGVFSNMLHGSKERAEHSMLVLEMKYKRQRGFQFIFGALMVVMAGLILKSSLKKPKPTTNVEVKEPQPDVGEDKGQSEDYSEYAPPGHRNKS